MPPNSQILRINQQGSDGDGRKWPKHHLVRNDEYFLERIAQDKWIHDLDGMAPDTTYRLDRLPAGYAGFEKARPDSKHVDRYIYGHPSGQFRSLNEFYPHFKHLMDFGTPKGCTCVNCKKIGNGNSNGHGNAKKRTIVSKAVQSRDVSEGSTARPQLSKYTADPDAQNEGAAAPHGQIISPFKRRDQSELDVPRPQKMKLVDVEGVSDVYELLIEKLKVAGSEGSIDEPIYERMSPDWRTGDLMGKELLQELRALPRYVPRTGEVVLFVRKLNDGEFVAWDGDVEAFRRRRVDSGEWLSQPQWEAGVVTQMPKEPMADRDLDGEQGKAQAVNDSGFRIEPLPEPGSQHKPYSKQHKYMPLHVIRPFSLWSECLTGVPEEKWHPTIHHAFTISSSFCVIGRFRFKGVWPDATVFCRGVYIGPELITTGDTVRLLPRSTEQKGDAITDVMVVTAIRLLFVNLDMGNNEDPIPLGVPYQTCLHISGKVYTLDPTRSFDGMGKVPIDAASGILPTGLHAYGQWYHYSDPKQGSARIELPYTRIMGRCYEDVAAKAWFGPRFEASRFSKQPAMQNDDDHIDISRGLEAITQARNYSQLKDTRIKAEEDRTWFWADTRIEQLDLHEVNNRPVGVKDNLRNRGQVAKWRASLKAIDGKKGALDQVSALKHAEAKQEKAKSQSAYGMVAASAHAGVESATEAEAEMPGEELQEAEEEEDDVMDIDDNEEGQEQSQSTSEDDDAPQNTLLRQPQTITLSDSDDSDEQETNQLASELAKKIRPNDPRLGRF